VETKSGDNWKGQKRPRGEKNHTTGPTHPERADLFAAKGVKGSPPKGSGILLPVCKQKWEIKKWRRRRLAGNNREARKAK